jgi:hypothetical protein
MSFLDCLDGQVTADRVNKERVEKAKRAYKEDYERALLEGIDPITADTAAAKKAVDAISSVNGIRRWQRIKDIRAMHDIQQRLLAAKDPVRELENIMLRVENHYENVIGVALSFLDNILLKYKPRAFVGSRTDGLDDIAHAAFGKSTFPEAEADAKAIREMLDFLRKWANRHGATIPDSPHNRLFQTHDAVKVSRARVYKLNDGTETNTWVEDHLREGIVDWDIMRLDGVAIPVEKRREALMSMYEGIISEGKMRDKYLTEGGVEGNLANRLTRDRFLHYKSSDAWIEMQGKYGAGNLYEQTIGMVEHMAKEISMLQTFGTSPGSMREFAGRFAEHEATKRAKAAGKNVQAEAKRAQRGVKLFNDMFDIHDRRVTSADGNWAVQAISGFRTMAVGSKLGGVLIPSIIGDLMNAKIMSKVYGLPQAGLIRNYISEVASGKISKAELIRSGIIYENATNLASSRVRYFGAMDGPHIARVFSDQVYRIGLASKHTQDARNAVGKQFLGFLHDTKNIKFDDHPLAPVMLEMGITSKDWDVMRSIGSYDVQGAKFLRPIDLMKIGNKDEQEVAEKFGALMQNYIRGAIPDTDLRSRRAMGEAIDPNSALGQFNRTMLSLLAFPMALHFNQLRRIASLPNIRDKMTYGAAYFTFMTLGGAIITQAKALVSGQQLYDMAPTNLDFWGRAMLNGGSMGILGDLMMNYININNSSYSPGDPTTELLKAVHKVTVDNLIDVAQGRPADIPADVFNLGNQLVPKFWHSKVLMERAILDAVQREYDPEGYRRALQYQRDHEEGMWWGRGEDPQALRLETAFGG